MPSASRTRITDCGGRSSNWSYRRGCRCPGCRRANADAAARRKATRRGAWPALCPVHDADVYDVCTCGGGE